MMTRKPNKQQRTNARWRQQRALHTAVPGSAEQEERRPLAGHEDSYEITRSGQVWSRRLKRFIKHAYNPIDSQGYIRVTAHGKRASVSIWHGVVSSWLTADDQERLRQSIPRDALGNATRLQEHRAAIRSVAREYGLPEQIIFALLLTARDE